MCGVRGIVNGVKVFDMVIVVNLDDGVFWECVWLYFV